MTLERRVFQLSAPQLDWLDQEAARLGISSAELLRRIVDYHRGEARLVLDRKVAWDEDGGDPCDSP